MKYIGEQALKTELKDFFENQLKYNQPCYDKLQLTKQDTLSFVEKYINQLIQENEEYV